MAESDSEYTVAKSEWRSKPILSVYAIMAKNLIGLSQMGVLGIIGVRLKFKASMCATAQLRSYYLSRSV